MPTVYLEPSDLSPLQAQQVLDFLNRATSAQQLNSDIEFPGEPDIGIKLGQRLLDARSALGGSFTALAQVRAVRLIGPERFTEICVAALGLEPTRWVELFYGGSPMAPQAETGLVVTLDPRPQPAWLGQPLRLTVRVADQGGTPRGGVAVALHTGAGRLVWMYGFQRFEGAAITVLTGVDGSAEVDLVRDPAEPLSELQQAALETALASLDVNAGDPLKLQADFRALALLYLNERNYNLRRAIDIHVSERRETMITSINPGTWRLVWPVDSVLLQADVLSPTGGGSTVARAVGTALWKNWVGAWLEFFGDLLREQAGFDSDFGRTLGSAEGPEVMGELMGRAQRAVAEQAGRSALWLGRKNVEQAMSKLVSSDLENVAPEARAAVLTQLEAAARDISPTTLGSFTLVSSVRKDVGLKVADLGALNVDQIARVEALALQVDLKAAEVNQQSAQVAQQSQLVTNSVQQFNTDYAKFGTDLTSFNASIANLVISPPGGVVVNPGLIGNVGNPGNVGVVVNPGIVGNVGNIGNVGNLGNAGVVRKTAPAKRPRRKKSDP